jgi:hypothetical protein
MSVLGKRLVKLSERVLRANYGLGRRLYEGFSEPLGVPTVYLEVTPT